MTQQEAIKRLLEDVKASSIQNTKSYTPTTEHYIPIHLLEYYLNMSYAIGYDEGRKQVSHRKKIIQIKDGVEIREWESEVIAANAFGVTKHMINKAVTGKIKHFRGFEWKRK